jgi:hypothetical protein
VRIGRQGSPGPGVDAEGWPVVDPTKNVDTLVEAAVKRLDDLRTVGEEHARETANLRAVHERELRVLESARIDAIRAVDVAASQQATKDAEVRASALAKQVSDAAEQQRNQVAAAAQAAATSLAAALVPIQERLAELTRLQYEQQGQKAQVIESRASDADFAPILSAIQSLQQTANENRGGREQVAQTRSNANFIYTLMGITIGFFTLIFLVIGFYLAIHKNSTNTTPTTTTPAQQIICTSSYHPSPPCP